MNLTEAVEHSQRFRRMTHRRPPTVIHVVEVGQDTWAGPGRERCRDRHHRDGSSRH